MRQLFKDAKHLRVTTNGTNYQNAAGTSDTLTSGAIDTIGFESVAIQLLVGAVTSTGTCTIKVQQSSDNGSTDDYTDIAGTAQVATTGDSNKAILVDIHRPAKRYLKVVTTRATANVAIDGLVAFLYGAGDVAVTQPAATVIGPEFFNTPAEGTA